VWVTKPSAKQPGEQFNARGAQDLVDADGFTALHWAAAFGHANNVQALLDAGIDPDRAPASGSKHVCHDLDKKCASRIPAPLSGISELSKWAHVKPGTSALAIAAKMDRSDIVKVLLASKTIEVNQQHATTGQTALSTIAAQPPTANSKTVLDLILKAGASVENEDNNSMTPLEHAYDSSVEGIMIAARSKYAAIEMQSGLSAFEAKEWKALRSSPMSECMFADKMSGLVATSLKTKGTPKEVIQALKALTSCLNGCSEPESGSCVDVMQQFAQDKIGKLLKGQASKITKEILKHIPQVANMQQLLPVLHALHELREAWEVVQQNAADVQEARANEEEIAANFGKHVREFRDLSVRYSNFRMELRKTLRASLGSGEKVTTVTISVRRNEIDEISNGVQVVSVKFVADCADARHEIDRIGQKIQEKSDAALNTYFGAIFAITLTDATGGAAAPFVMAATVTGATIKIGSNVMTNTEFRATQGKLVLTHDGAHKFKKLADETQTNLKQARLQLDNKEL